MISIKCSSPDTAKLVDMTPFQGELKKRTEQDLSNLGQSLLDDGLLMPFALWQAPDNTLYILDGHGRMQALVRLALSYPAILEQEYPVLLITADTEDEARKALLQITSTYGRFNKKAVVQFAAPILDYKAPILVKSQRVVQRTDKPDVDNSRVIVRLSVAKDKVKQLSALLKQVEGVEVF